MDVYDVDFGFDIQALERLICCMNFYLYNER